MKKPFVSVNGWLAFDKPEGISSAKAVARLRKLFCAKKAGHAGTLDPLASGLLPVAFGEATKTISFLTNQTKTYEWEATFGAKTDTGDREGKVIAENEVIPSKQELEAILPHFIGTISQTPPNFSAIKINGQPAYKKARRGEDFQLNARQVTIESIALIDTCGKKATFTTTCQKGVYVRTLAEDIAQKLGAFAHITRLRRVHNGCFLAKDSISLDKIEEIVHSESGQDENLSLRLKALLLPLEKVLEGLPQIPLAADQAQRLRFGQSVIIHSQTESSVDKTICLALENGAPVGLAELQEHTLVPKKLFNL